MIRTQYLVILALIFPVCFTSAAEDEFEQGPTDAEVKAYKKSKFSVSFFYNFANEIRGEGTSSGTGADGQFDAFYDSNPSFGLGLNYSAFRFWRMRMDFSLLVENTRSVDSFRLKTENATSSTSANFDVGPMFTLATQVYYPIARKFELWAGLNYTEINFDSPNSSIDGDLGYQAGIGYNWTPRWTAELGFYSKRATGVVNGSPNLPFDHLEVNGLSLFIKYYL